MAIPAAVRSDHVSKVRQQARKLLDAYDELTALKAQWDALDLGTVLVEGDFAGGNAGLTKTDLAAVYTSLGAFQTLLAAGHRTNLETVAS